ncbi:glycosyltransferase [Novosphingobium sp. 9]|uniref:glycosyltransferase n=1 Tax=Novosphingobium sp. 9 TaxID=2025349 RepID=UPI0021B5CE2B|nr:glycosyltransferase [Novosphingobium sp. 9]
MTEPNQAAAQTVRLRIAVPIHSLDPGGVERVGVNLAARWHEAGHDVTVVLGRIASRHLSSAPSINYWRIPNRYASVAWETPWMIFTLLRYLRRNETDVVFLPGNTYAIVGALVRLLAPLVLKRRMPPMVLKISNALERADMPSALRRGYAAWLRLHARLFDRMIALSDAMRDEVLRATTAAPEQVCTIANPILSRHRIETLARISQPERRDGAMHFVSAGRLVTQKNYPLLLRAFAAVWQRGDRLTIAGEGPERARLERLAAELGIAASVDLPGHLGSVDGLLAKADAFVLSSDYEGLPGVVVEALAAGLPVAATDCCASMSGLLDHGRIGLLVAPRNVEALAAAMNGLRDHTFSNAAARAVAARYEIEAASVEYLDLMADLKGTRAAATTPSPSPRTMPPSMAGVDGRRRRAL